MQIRAYVRRTSTELTRFKKKTQIDLTKKEIIKTKYVDHLEQFIEQESLRHVIHDMENRIGFAIDPRRFDDL